MGKEWISPKLKFLFFILFLSIIYNGLLTISFPVTGDHRIDGIIGITIGIYVCAHPAANLLDFVLYGRHLGLFSLPVRVLFWFWFINALVMGSGLLVFVTSLLRYSAVA